MPYVNYVEFNVGDVEASRAFYNKVFGWEPQEWGDPDYLVSTHGDEPGIDTGITKSPDGEPITVAVISVEDIAATLATALTAGAEILVPKFEIPGVGLAAYIADPNGLMIGLHEPLAQSEA